MYLLNRVAEMGAVPGLRVPEDFYWVYDGEAPLAGMKNPPETTPWERLRMLGFRYIINLESTKPMYRPRPVHLLGAMRLEDLFHGREPSNPDRELRLIREAVELIAENLRPDAGVIVHCMGGRGRTGTVLGCYLRAVGMPADQVIADLDRLHTARGTNGWPESDWQEQIVRDYPSSLGARK